MIARSLVLWLLCWCCGAHAIGTVTQNVGTAYRGGDGNETLCPWMGSPSVAVETCARNVYGVSSVSASCTQAAPTAFTCSWAGFGAQVGNRSGTMNAVIQTQSTCPPGSADAGGGQCKCLPGSRPGADNSCVAYQCPRGGLSFPNDGYGPLPQTDVMKSRLTCVGPGGPYYGCTLEFTAASAKCTDATHCWSTGSSQTNGEYCDGTPAQPKTPLPDEPTLPPPSPPCASQPGTCPGNVNGQNVCLACSWTQDKPTTTTEDKPDGTSTGTETKTECNGTTCTTTTTTTTTGPGGTGTTVKVEVEPQDGFCEQNPTFSACKEGRWGGSCQGGFSCDGDAIQCAIARDQHQRHCQLLETHTTFSQAGADMADNDPFPQGHPHNDAETKTIDFSQQIDQTDPLGGGSCPGDRTIAIHGGSVVIPFSSLCGPLSFFGQIAVACCLLMAAFIAFKQ